VSLHALTHVHTVQRFEPFVLNGAAFGVQRDYHYDAPDSILECRVVELAESGRTQLMQEGWVVSHKIHFDFDPQFTLLTRLKFPANVNGVILRVDPAIDQHGQGRLWIANATALSEDNPTIKTLG
jgi:hypothetical protein